MHHNPLWFREKTQRFVEFSNSLSLYKRCALLEMMKDQLTFELKSRRGTNNIPPGITKSERTYYDFIVSGNSLGEILGANKLDLIGNFGWTDNLEYESGQLSEFLMEKEPSLETDRIMFYVCAECGDIGCGALTGKISATENEIIWSEFAYENNYEEYDLTEYENIGPFIFEKETYRNIINQLKRKLN